MITKEKALDNVKQYLKDFRIVIFTVYNNPVFDFRSKLSILGKMFS